MLRQPIITVLGHVDHGKTTLLDYIRGSAVAAKEAGAITQHVGATSIPLKTIKSLCGDLTNLFKIQLNIPGLLFIDTPGHEAFTNLRKRGGSIADLAILIVDINQGVQPQTKEAVDILKTFKVPFIVAANKIDVISGWKSQSKVFIKNIKKQLDAAKQNYEKKFYRLLGQISERGFNCNLYTEISDYKKEVAVVPISSKTGEGVAELLALLVGLSQKFLKDRLEIDEKSGVRGTVLEIKEEKGMGTTADIIIYDGILTKDDYLAIGGENTAIKTKVRALFEPAPLSEIREKGTKFKTVDKISAAAGVKILAPDIDKALAGTPIISARTEKEIDAAVKKIEKEIKGVLIETEEAGIILKCDTLGSLEAVTQMLKNKDLTIKHASIGDITRRDIMLAKSALETEPLNAFVLGFNVKIQDAAATLIKDSAVSVITDPVIYKLIEKYEEELERKKKQKELAELDGLTWPAKLKILPGFVFRQSNPAIFGVEVLAGKLKPKVSLMTENGKEVGRIKSLENQGEKLEKAKQGEQIAIAVIGLSIGRQASEGHELYTSMPEENYRRFKKKKHLLSKSEADVLKEIAKIMRQENITWGI